MIALLLAGCARPPVAPAGAPPPPEPQPVEARVDGWSLLQGDGTWLWTDLAGPQAAAIAEEAVADGFPAQQVLSGPPAALSQEAARRFLSASGVPARPRAWTWTDEPGPLVAVAPELHGVAPIRDTGGLALRAWFRVLAEDGPDLALTDWSSEGAAPRGERERPERALPVRCGTEQAPWRDPTRPACEHCVRMCSELALDDGRLLATEHPWIDEEGAVAGSCAATMLLRPEGGRAHFAPSCRSFEGHGAEHLAEGVYSSATGPSLPTAWFGRGDARWLVVNRFDGPVQTRCLARFPEVDEPIHPLACVRGRQDLGGF